MKITTNNIPRELVTFHDIPKKSQPDFDYVTEDAQFEYRFIQYKGSWYDTYDTQCIAVNHGQFMGWTMAVEEDSPLAKWHAVIGESYFSGVLFRFTGESMVICGSYSS